LTVIGKKTLLISGLTIVVKPAAKKRDEIIKIKTLNKIIIHPT